MNSAFSLAFILCDSEYKLSQFGENRRRQSEALFGEGGRRLAACLGEVAEAAPRGAYSVRSFHASFGEGKRLDAEYYVPEYEACQALLTAYRYG